MNIPLRPVILTSLTLALIASLSACLNGTDCGTDHKVGYRDLFRDTAMVVQGKVAYVQFDESVRGDFRKFDSTSYSPPRLERKEKSGLGDTLRFHVVFREMFWDTPDDSVPTESYLLVSTTPEQAVAWRASFAARSMCGDGNPGAARQPVALDDPLEVACSIEPPNHTIEEIVIEYETGRKVIVGF